MGMGGDLGMGGDCALQETAEIPDHATPSTMRRRIGTACIMACSTPPTIPLNKKVYINEY